MTDQFKPDDPGDLLRFLEGEGDAKLPAGVKLASLSAIGIAPPRRSGNARNDAAALRAFRASRLPVLTDGADAAWEASAAALAAYQRELTERAWIVGETAKPTGGRYSLRWIKIKDELGEWWASPSGKVLLNAKFFTPPAPEPAPMPRDVNRAPQGDAAIYRPRHVRPVW